METAKVQETETNLKAQIKAKWGKLTDLDVSEAEQKPETLSNKIQQAYGLNKEAVDKEVTEFRKSIAVEVKPVTAAVAN